jgi:SAM-dependent methyltransferase
MTMSDVPGYIHGYTDEEAQRLIDQAEFLAPWVFDGVALDGVRTLLEVGMGVGAETRLLRARWPALHVTGVDVSEGQLARARRTLADDLASGHVRLVRAFGNRLPLADDSFDAAFFIWVLEHVADPQAVLAEATRCLKPGGRVTAIEVYNRSLLVEPNGAIIHDYFAALSEAQRRGGGHPDIAARLPSLATGAGLEVTSFRLFSTLGDRRDPKRRTALLRYFQGLLRSAEPQIRASGLFPEERIEDVWRAFDEVVAAPDALLCYIGGQLEARKPEAA